MRRAPRSRLTLDAHRATTAHAPWTATAVVAHLGRGRGGSGCTLAPPHGDGGSPARGHGVVAGGRAHERL